MRDVSTRARVASAALTAAAASGVVAYRRMARRLDMAPTAAPPLPGTVVGLTTEWGRLSYRFVEGAVPDAPPLVLVHGWGRSGDSAWWPIITRTSRPVLAVDLPGHGRSVLERRFTFDLAAEAVITATEHAGLQNAQLVGHSMGGPVCLTALLHADRSLYSSFVALATSAWWVGPRSRLTVFAAPWVLAPRSPILLRAQSRELDAQPSIAGRIAWEYATRPPRSVLVDAALELRRFDARRWGPLLRLPPTTFGIAVDDGVIPHGDQRASAAFFGARSVDILSDHSVVSLAPDAVTKLLDLAAVRPDGPLLVAI